MRVICTTSYGGCLISADVRHTSNNHLMKFDDICSKFSVGNAFSECVTRNAHFRKNLRTPNPLVTADRIWDANPPKIYLVWRVLLCVAFCSIFSLLTWRYGLEWVSVHASHRICLIASDEEQRGCTDVSNVRVGYGISRSYGKAAFSET